jgi:tRNA (guanosine-2'-O-)-methyltransferase
MEFKDLFVTEGRLKKFLSVLSKKQKDLEVFIDNVKNEHNFSAIVRTCDAVGVLNLYYRYEGNKQNLINESISRGSHKWVFLNKVDNIEKFFKEKKEKGFQIVATYLSDDSIHFRKIDYTKPTVVVMGNELEGVSEDILRFTDHKIIIPMYGMVQSLNVSVATAVVLYEAERQRSEKGMYEKPTLSEEEIKNIIYKWGREDILKTNI